MANPILMLRVAVFSALLALAASCDAEEVRSTSEATLDGDTALDIAPRSEATPPARFPVPEDETCEFDASFVHADPDSLISEFLTRDAYGDFLQTSDWFAGATMCPGHEPGPDSYTVIEGYDVAPLERTSYRVGVVVTAPRVGYVFSTGLVDDPGTDVDTVFAVLTPHGWRVESPARRLRVLASVARERGDLADETDGGRDP